MSFYQEWKKTIWCVGLFVLLFALQYFTGSDFSSWTNTLLDLIMGTLGVGAVRYSILSGSERKLLKDNLPEKHDDDIDAFDRSRELE